MVPELNSTLNTVIHKSKYQSLTVVTHLRQKLFNFNSKIAEIYSTFYGHKIRKRTYYVCYKPHNNTSLNLKFVKMGDFNYY